MFHKNPLLVKLKKKLTSEVFRVEGIVKSTEKGFGFLEIDEQKSYFIPSLHMKKVMHGDRITAIIHIDKGESAEPEKLIEPFLTRFVGKILKKDNHLFIIPDHPLLKDAIPCRAIQDISNPLKEGDWFVAEMRYHPLKDDRGFYAELTQFITNNGDNLVPWRVTLARHNLEKEAPDNIEVEMIDEGLERRDLTALNFITIDSNDTEDIDDALYAEEDINGRLHLTVAIADPTAWISEGSKLDNIARIRAFTNYLPGLNIPMLPRKLSNDLFSLRTNQIRPVLACHMIVEESGVITEGIEFFAAKIRSKARLIYNEVSDWLESTGKWKPQSNDIAKQILLLHRICLNRSKWRHNHALICKDRPDYRFIFGKKSEVLDIIVEPRRIANRIVEEAMIAANICAAYILREKLGFGIYNVHNGFDPANGKALISLLKTYDVQINLEEVFTLTGFCKLRRRLDTISSNFLDNRIRRLQSFAGVSIRPGPHFGLGLEAYATWTSPIRKYGDMINHRLLKAVIKGESISCPKEETTVLISERRRLHRIAERDVGDWLYARFFNGRININKHFPAEIIDISRGGIRVRLTDSGAKAFVPSVFLHSVRNELICNQEHGFIEIRGEIVYKIADRIDITISEVRMETRSIIARPVFQF